MKEEYNEELAKPLPEHDEEQDDDDDQEEEEEEEEEEDMVGLSDQFSLIKDCILKKRKNAYVLSIVGMAGIGKTALARRIFEDPFISKRFKCRALVKIGQTYRLEELKQAILAQVNPDYDDEMGMENDERLNEYLDKKRCLIVLDDVWDLGFWDDYFKDRDAKKSCIVVTTRLEELAYQLGGEADHFHMPFLNDEESWLLLRRRVFGDGVCPPELEKVGMEIAEKCEGLPLMIITVADILSDERRLEYWNEVAHQKHNSVFEEAYNRILPLLYPSYDNLPPHVKACFLYMAAFPPSYQVSRSKLVNLWCTEGFLEPDDSSTPLKDFASQCFDVLNSDHVVVPAPHLSSDGQTYQACSLHSVFRHLCRKELEINEFLHIIDGYGYEDEDGNGDGDGDADGDVSTQSKKSSWRRISIYHAVLLSYKDVRTSIDSATTARSLLCTGPYHQYQVPINFNLRLLRVCDALTIRFYEFPCEMLELVQLRYFAITCNKNLPPSISRLWKLEYLIVYQHLSIKSTIAESYVPMEIWDLQELRHLQLIGRNLPNPPSTDVVLPQLVKLLDVGICSCTEGVLKSIPNLHKLRVQIELAPNLVEPLSYLYYTSHLHGLLSLQCVIVNPMLTSQIAAKPSHSFSSSSITKLTLSGLGHPWEYLNKFVKLPHLRVLKLLCYAFRGEMWEVNRKRFLQLECLTIEDSDLVEWKAGVGAFPNLTHLTLKSCYKLQKLPKMSSQTQIELVDCNPVAVARAKKMKCDNVFSSWDGEGDSRNCIYGLFTTKSVVYTMYDD